MKKLLFLLLGVLLTSSFVFSANYTLDNNSVDQLFNNAVECSFSNATSVLDNSFALQNGTTLSSADNTTTILIAWVVDWFVGGFGIHRYVLGTKSNMWAIYTFTVCGIFGIVPMVDWFVLLIDGLIMKNGDKYMNNDKFFMWAN